MWKEVQRTRKKSPVQSLCRVVTSVTHDSPSRSPMIDTDIVACTSDIMTYDILAVPPLHSRQQVYDKLT